MADFSKKSYLCTPMDRVDGYKVDLKGMTEDAVSHRWHLTDDFFSAVHGPEIASGQVDVALRVKRTSELITLIVLFSSLLPYPAI